MTGIGGWEKGILRKKRKNEKATENEDKKTAGVE